jgi:hypothetical protein
MAAAAASNNIRDEISSRLIANDEFVPYMYSIIQNAGRAATESDEVKSNIHNVCVIPKGTRYRTNYTVSRENADYTLEYNADDILIVGGVVLNLYDRLLSVKENSTRRISSLKEFLKRETLDIDMKWWPRVTSPDGKIITSFSQALRKLTTIFNNNLASTLKEKVGEINEKVKEVLSSYDIGKFDIKTELLPYIIFGNETITIKFIINSIEIKICEIAIYDGGNSQTFNEWGEKIEEILPMTDDIYYSIPSSFGLISYESAKIIKINNVNIAIPSLIHYIKQQLFTFYILTRDKDNTNEKKTIKKGMNSYKRVFFIRELLSQFKSNSNYNNTLFSSIINRTTNLTETQRGLIVWINTNIYDIFDKNKHNLLAMCNIYESDIATIFMCNEILPVVELVFPNRVLASKNTGNSIPVFSGPEEARMYAAKMYPTIGSGLKKRTHRQKHKSRKHKTRKYRK